MLSFVYCPMCGVSWDEYDREHGCFCCGYKQTDEAGVIIPDKCDDHPKYKGIGVPVTDCPTCWRMHYGLVAAKVKELG